MVRNDNFTFVWLELILADLPPHYWLLVVRNGDFTFLLLDLILVDDVADLPPPISGF